MLQSSFETKIPQMGRAESSESHPVKNSGSLMDSGGGRKSTNRNKTKQNYTHEILIATYNVRTMRTDSHLEELEQELKHIKWDIVGICETRLQGEKKITLRSGHTLYQNNSETNHSQGGVAFIVNHKIEHNITKYQAISERVIYLIIRLNRRYSIQIIHCYAPTSTASDESIEQFYEDITRAKNSENPHYVIITGDFNAKVGKREPNDTKYVGNFGLGDRNNRGETLVNYLNNEKLFCLNTFFKKQAQRKWTWHSPDGQVKNEIDYILANRSNICKDVSVLNQFHTGSDHRLVRANIQINTKLERKKLMTKYKFPTSDVLILNKETYQKEIEKKLDPKTLQDKNIDEITEKVEESIRTATKKICGRAKNQSNNKLRPETIKLIVERRKTDRNTPPYKTINNTVKKQIRTDLKAHKTTYIP